MKQKILYILVMITALIGGNGEAWAADNWGPLPISGQSYAEGDATWGGFTYKDRIKEVYFSGIPDKLTFRYDATDAATEEYWSISESADGKTWNNIWETEDNPNSGEASINLAPSTRYVRFHYYGNFRGSFQNISITERRYLTADKSSIDFSSLNTNATPTPQTVIVSHCNAGAGVTIESNHPKFKVNKSSLSSTGANKMGTEDFTVTFDNSEVGTYTGEITIKDPSGKNSSITIQVRGVATKEKTDPDFTWTLSNLATGREYTDFFSSTNTDTPVSYVSSDATIANVVDGKLVTFSKEGTATITVTQQGNDDWNEYSESFTVSVSKPQNHLPLAINESNWSVLARNISGGSFKWDGGIQHHSLAYGNREFEIAFEGIPDKLTFNYTCTNSNIDGEVKWTVYEGSDGNNFTEAWTKGGRNGTATVQLKPTTRFVRIKCYCIYYENVSNIQISELRYLTSTTSSLDFGENVEGEAVSKTFTVKHANAGYGVTLTSSNPDVFEVSPAVLTTTGGDKMGEETITVTYKNNAEGSNSETITIADPSGANAAITLNVAGTTLSNTLFLKPLEFPNYDVRTYKRIVLERTLPMGYSTITLPFTYDIDNVEGGAFVAQLELVTHNQQDCYTLYFRKVADGVMQPNQPYVLYMPFEITNAEWGETAISSPNAQEVKKNGWTMRANYTPELPMKGNYGIAGGEFRLGTDGSTINAYTAYFIPPTHSHGTENVRARVAVMDEGGNTTYIGELKDLDGNAAEEVFGIDGMRLPEMRRGINIVRQKDGSVRKIVK